MEYRYTADGQLGGNAEQITEQLENSRQGWNITLSRDGFSAHRTFREEQDAEKLRQVVREIVSQYLRALSFEIGVNIELAPSSSVQVRKPGRVGVEIFVHPAPAEVIVSTSRILPEAERVEELANACNSDLLVPEVVDLYLQACEANRDQDIATSLYKAWEAIEATFDGEKEMAEALEIRGWKNLKQNLNWHRHWPKKYPPPKKQLSVAHCKQRMKQVILSLLEHRSR